MLNKPTLTFKTSPIKTSPITFICVICNGETWNWTRSIIRGDEYQKERLANIRASIEQHSRINVLNGMVANAYPAFCDCCSRLTVQFNQV